MSTALSILRWVCAGVLHWPRKKACVSAARCYATTDGGGFLCGYGHTQVLGFAVQASLCVYAHMACHVDCKRSVSHPFLLTEVTTVHYYGTCCPVQLTGLSSGGSLLAWLLLAVQYCASLRSLQVSQVAAGELSERCAGVPQPSCEPVMSVHSSCIP